MIPVAVKTRVLALGACAAIALALSACESDNVDENADLIAGKKAFVEKCGACHVLARAGTKGTQGPNLDESFRRAIVDGFGRDTIHGVVADQIAFPAKVDEKSPAYMPAALVTGKLASDVAAYVAAVAARPGEDKGRLKAAVQAAGGGKPVAAENGVLEMPADPTGQLAYVTKEASAPAGELKVNSKNDSSVPHDIALEGNGVTAKGATVQGGGVSTFTVALKPGEYVYYCTVTGHREGGMEGKLTVK